MKLNPKHHNTFLPKVMSESETKVVVEVIINTLPEKSIKMMGKVMKTISNEYCDLIDKGIASKIVKEALA